LTSGKGDVTVIPHLQTSLRVLRRRDMFKFVRSLTTLSNMRLDPAVIQLLGLDPDKTYVSSAGGGGMSSASTSKIVSQLGDGTEKAYFMKTGSGKEADVMFEGACVVSHACHR
jgi:hypothetical protein